MKTVKVKTVARKASASLAPSTEKVLVWLENEEAFCAPPMSKAAYEEASTLLRMLQFGTQLTMPASRRMPRIGRRTHELRIKDAAAEWRIIYRLDSDAVLIAEIFKKKTRATPISVINNSKRRLRQYDKAATDDLG